MRAKYSGVKNTKYILKYKNYIKKNIYMVLEIKPVLDCDLLQIFATSCIPWSWKPDQSSVTVEKEEAHRHKTEKLGLGGLCPS